MGAPVVFIRSAQGHDPPICIISSLISIEPSMSGSVVWKWKADAYRHATGSSMSKSSPRAAFAEWCHPPPRNSVECGNFNRNVMGLGCYHVIRWSLCTSINVVVLFYIFKNLREAKTHCK